jgi:Arc/MetJ-type ribon-helix-helix transcriptional regulator
MNATEKISATLPRRDLAFLNEYIEQHGVSRSGALHEAVRALREKSLMSAYLAADDEWFADEETASAWDRAVADGIQATAEDDG